jgi:hypothetical protein
MEDVEKTGHDCPPITSQHHDPDRNFASPRTDSRITRITSNISQAASRTKRPKDILQKEKYPEQELEKGIVGWEGQDDPQNPRYVLLLAMHGLVRLICFKKLSRSSKMDPPGARQLYRSHQSTGVLLVCTCYQVHGRRVWELINSPEFVCCDYTFLAMRYVTTYQHLT